MIIKKLMFLKIFLCLYAININSMNIDEYLAKERAENNQVDNDLIDAIRAKDIKLAQSAIERGANVNCIAGRSAFNCKAGLLHLAIMYENLEALKLLIEQKAALHDRNRNHQTPLIYAVVHKQSEMVKLLIEAKSQLECSDNDQNTALNWAAFNGNIKIADQLIKAKADINSVDKSNKSILEWASDEGRDDVVKLLLNNNVDKQIDKKNNALFYAITRQNFETTKILLMNGFLLASDDLPSYLFVNKFLQDHKIDKEDINFTPFFWAVIFNDKEMVEKFLNEDADFCPSGSRDLIKFAAARSNPEINQILLNRLAAIIDFLSEKNLPIPLCKLIRQYLYNY